MSHYVTKCSCGKVIAQCRCPVSWSDKGLGKPVTVIERGCENCHMSTVLVEHLSGGIWQLSADGNSLLISKEDWQYIHSIIHDHYHGED